VRKAARLPQFSVYEKLAPASIGLQTGKIWPHISVNIPFRAEIHQYSSESTSKYANRESLASLSSIALNGAQKALKMPQNWLKNQLNDHISTFFWLFLLYFYSISILELI
jgi:hypothetical protein